MERVVRNNTRKSSLFKIQAQKNKFEDHFTDFGCCRLLQNHPECTKYENYLKELTEVFIKYSFEVGESSPFFQGMNYNGRHCGFTNDSHSFSYRDWIPNAKQVFLQGPCNKESPQRFELTSQGKGFFDLKVDEHFQTFADGDTVRLVITDNDGKQFKCVPPSARRMVHDPTSGELFGVYNRTQKTKAEDSSVPSTSFLSIVMDVHEQPLQKWLEMLPRIIKSKFNTVIIKNIFNYVDKNIKVSLINRYSIKMTASQIDILQEIIEKLKDEQIKVLFEIDFQHERYQLQNSLEAGYLTSEGAFQFDLKKPEVMPFLLASLTYLMNHFKIDGFKFDNIDRILLRNECLPRYSQPLSFSETFIEDCSRESILFTKLINMIVERNNSNFISYCSSNCMVPGLYIPLVEGGFGFSFSSQKSSKRVHSFSREYLTGNILIADRSTQLYFNTIEIDNEMTTSQEELQVMTDFMWSASGVVCTNAGILTKDSSIDLLQGLLQLREQGEYFMETALVSKDYIHSPDLASFHRNKYVFLINFATEKRQVSMKHSQPADLIYCSKASETENVNPNFHDDILDVVVPPQTAIVLEKARIN